jgi:hypothetical protein
MADTGSRTRTTSSLSRKAGATASFEYSRYAWQPRRPACTPSSLGLVSPAGGHVVSRDDDRLLQQGACHDSRSLALVSLLPLTSVKCNPYAACDACPLPCASLTFQSFPKLITRPALQSLTFHTRSDSSLPLRSSSPSPPPPPLYCPS